MQSVTMSGWLKLEPELKCISKDNVQVFICRCLLKVGRFTKDGFVFDYFQTTCFGKRAEYMAKACHKEDKVVVKGEFRNFNYKDGNGTKHYTNYLLINDIEVEKGITKKTKAENDVPNAYDSANGISESEVSFMMENGFMPIDEAVFDEIPS